jgi:hypothetical protein
MIGPTPGTSSEHDPAAYRPLGGPFGGVAAGGIHELRLLTLVLHGDTDLLVPEARRLEVTDGGLGVMSVIEEADDRAPGGAFMGRGVLVALSRHRSNPSKCYGVMYGQAAQRDAFAMSSQAEGGT